MNGSLAVLEPEQMQTAGFIFLSVNGWFTGLFQFTVSAKQFGTCHFQDSWYTGCSSITCDTDNNLNAVHRIIPLRAIFG